ncbi:hypothetical protein FHR24_000875 [Wenyingzhuangia heitensis]|uniref:Uncharacterized protein n=1 Tax=Wenyingzhuangia heitensis TaxID=1487859 RepID=A0ABX0UA44_9FLAO|nr:hypothetical protein [Wenyingzhuangia heitensis]NIJ44436.1 hypothetical protein [Wenyingzhuangia heitensis]
MKKNRQFNLKEILTTQFGFTSVDIDRYQTILNDQSKIETLKNSVLYVLSKPQFFKTQEHKRNTLLKKCRELAYEVNMHNTTSISDFIQKNLRNNNQNK